MKARIRAESSTPAMPMTRSRGNFDSLSTAWAIASSGFDTGMMMQFGRVLHHLLGHLLHDLVVHVQQVVAAHAGLARHARRDDDDVRVRALGVVAGAHHARIGSVDRARLEDVERDARPPSDRRCR